MNGDGFKDSSNWTVRAVACELLSISFRYPEDDLAAALSSGEWAEAAQEVAEMLGFELPASFELDAREGEGRDPQALLHELRAEATRLFIGAPKPAVSPYGGVVRSHKEGVKALLFVNPYSMGVERFCRSCGLGRPEGTNEPLDHVGTELELLQHLASLSVGISSPHEGAPAPDALPGGSAEGAYGLFMRDHAITWMPGFAEDVAEATRMPFYRAAALLLAAFLESEGAAIDRPSGL